MTARLDRAPDLPAGWTMMLPGYAVDNGQTKRERKAEHVVRYCDARGGRVKTWSSSEDGIPAEVVTACLAAARDYPEEFAL